MFCQKCGTQLSDSVAFCPRCGAQIAAGTYTPPVSAQTPASGANVSQNIVDIKKVLYDISSSVVGGLIAHSVILLILKLFMGDGDPGWYLVIYWTIFAMIPEVIVTFLRITDPADAAYKIGRTQDEEIEKSFRKKYERLRSVMGWIVNGMVILYILASLWHNFRISDPAEFREMERMLSELVNSI